MPAFSNPVSTSTRSQNEMSFVLSRLGRRTGVRMTVATTLRRSARFTCHISVIGEASMYRLRRRVTCASALLSRVYVVAMMRPEPSLCDRMSRDGEIGEVERVRERVSLGKELTGRQLR